MEGGGEWSRSELRRRTAEILRVFSGRKAKCRLIGRWPVASGGGCAVVPPQLGAEGAGGSGASRADSEGSGRCGTNTVCPARQSGSRRKQMRRVCGARCGFMGDGG